MGHIGGIDHAAMRVMIPRALGLSNLRSTQIQLLLTTSENLAEAGEELGRCAETLRQRLLGNFHRLDSDMR